MRFLVAVLALLLARPVLAAGGGSSGAEFLRVGMGARPAALGENFTGLADDVTTANWNPAGLGQLDHWEISGMGLSYVAGTTYGYLAASAPIGRWGSLAVSSIYAGVPSFDSTAPGSGMPAGSGLDGMLALSWGGSFKALAPDSDYQHLYYGLTAKGIFRSLGGYQPAGGAPETLTAQTFAGDFGFLYEARPGLTIGGSVLNIGPPIGFLGDEADALPLMARIGAGWRAIDTGSIRAVVVADYAKPTDPDHGHFLQSTWGGAGVEVTIARMVALRGGFRQGADGARIVGGAGFTYEGFSLDYAFIPLATLGTGHRLGLTYKMGAVARLLDAVHDLVAERMPDQKVHLSWAQVQGAAGYVVDMLSPGATAPRRLTKKPRQAPELSLKGLKGGAAYRFTVRPVDAVGREGRSADAEILLPLAVAAKLGTPGQVAIRQIPGGRVAFAWAPVSGAVGYHVFYKLPSGKWKRLTKTPRVLSSVTLKGLKPGAYTFAVAATDAAGKLSKVKPVPVTLQP